MVDNLYDAMNEPRYCGIPTFMRTPYITDLNDLDIALLGIPYDGAVEARSGARQGSRQVRDMSSMMRKIHQGTWPSLLQRSCMKYYVLSLKQNIHHQK